MSFDSHEWHGSMMSSSRCKKSRRRDALVGLARVYHQMSCLFRGNRISAEFSRNPRFKIESEEETETEEDTKIKDVLGLRVSKGEDNILSLLLLKELGELLPMGKEFPE